MEDLTTKRSTISLLLPGLAGTGIEDEFEDVQRSSAEETAEGVPGWEALRRFVTGKSHTVTGEYKRSVELGAYWLTLPDAPDAKVEFSISDAKTTDTSASLTVAGVEGGPQFTIELKEGLKHEAKCSEKGVVSAIATFQHISVTNRLEPRPGIGAAQHGDLVPQHEPLGVPGGR